ncbi:hypothetical protein O181_095834 [Austropuccinia psidii MF-1]|uniref:Uncharacterized protein n=1 Tax=Austropuccinia psidii MF-1 TaxID=1389203 RepID=A0A9Q3J653_9BASI|nr:hypothetical protein [Austropuccinia psidii MF-1]
MDTCLRASSHPEADARSFISHFSASNPSFRNQSPIQLSGASNALASPMKHSFSLALISINKHPFTKSQRQSSRHSTYMSYTYDLEDTLRQNFQHNEIQDLKSTLATREQQLSVLLQKVEALEVQVGSKNTRKKSSNAEPKPGTTKDICLPHKKEKEKITPHHKLTVNKRTSSNHHQQKPTPKTPSPKRSPNQLLMSEIPENFKHTKEALYVHIRILWGMTERQKVPPSPNRSLLKEFYGLFSTNEEILEAANTTSNVSLINSTEVQTLRDARAGRKKVGKNIVNFQEFYILYIHSISAKVGICIWGLDLEEAPDSLYNEAC